MKVALLFVTLTCLALTLASVLPKEDETFTCADCKYYFLLMEECINEGCDNQLIEKAIMDLCHLANGDPVAKDEATCLKILTGLNTEVQKDHTQNPEDVCRSQGYCGK